MGVHAGRLSAADGSGRGGLTQTNGLQESRGGSGRHVVIGHVPVDPESGRGGNSICRWQQGRIHVESQIQFRAVSGRSIKDK